jgi:hypothetical protein
MSDTAQAISITSACPASSKKTIEISKADFRLEYHTGLYLLFPLNKCSRQWLNENIGENNGVQPLWPTVVIEPRFLNQIVADLRRDKLVMR